MPHPPAHVKPDAAPGAPQALAPNFRRASRYAAAAPVPRAARARAEGSGAPTAGSPLVVPVPGSDTGSPAAAPPPAEFVAAAAPGAVGGGMAASAAAAASVSSRATAYRIPSLLGAPFPGAIALPGARHYHIDPPRVNRRLDRGL